MATIKYPYIRTTFTKDPINEPFKTAKAGDEFRMGTGKQSRVVKLYSYGELDAVYGAGNFYKVTVDASNPLINTPVSMGAGVSIMAEKTVATDEDGHMIIEYRSEGLLLARAMGRSSHNGANTTTSNATTHIMLQKASSADVHLPLSLIHISEPTRPY